MQLQLNLGPDAPLQSPRSTKAQPSSTAKSKSGGENIEPAAEEDYSPSPQAEQETERRNLINEVNPAFATEASEARKPNQVNLDQSSRDDSDQSGKRTKKKANNLDDEPPSL